MRAFPSKLTATIEYDNGEIVTYEVPYPRITTVLTRKGSRQPVSTLEITATTEVAEVIVSKRYASLEES